MQVFLSHNFKAQMSAFLSKEGSIAKPGYSRWLFPPAALSIHLCIGQVYSFSVFNNPLKSILGVSASGPGDWTDKQIVWIFTIAIAFLGLSAMTFGKWVEKNGPRRSMLAAALCFSGGFFVSALGIKLHQIWLVYLGYGVLGGCGLGLGYISPVSTLMKWFPDKPGMATGMAIMGFGGGAMIGSPLAVMLMDKYSSATSNGVLETFLTMGSIYLVFMLYGVITARIPAPDWKPEGWSPDETKKDKLITSNHVSADNAIKTRQFWQLWIILCFNVTAGIGLLAVASPMIQTVLGVSPYVAGGFVGLLSLFNLLGRFFWSSFSDVIGRKKVYIIYLGLGAVVYSLIPNIAVLGSLTLFVLAWGLIYSMYGGGFATIPAYLKDLFGTYQVGAIHGRLLTAWSAAGVLGPGLVVFIRQMALDRGVTEAQSYNQVMYVMAALLVVGLLSNLLVKPVSSKYHEPILQKQ
jgi:MFS family permease